VPGWSTGAEAYSIAILLEERMVALKQHTLVQVFATARAGLYRASIAADVSEKRLELKSSNEEPETSKEEMQPLNEELSTVNTELQRKVADLTRINKDMNKLLAGTGMATVFVDPALRILRFTPLATRVINPVAAGVGRPVAQIVSNLVGYNSLTADLHEVLDTLVPKAVEVDTADGACHSMRLQLCRTLDNVIEGAVISFLDITEKQRLRDALKQANDPARGEVPAPHRSHRHTRGRTELAVGVAATARLDQTGRMYAVATTERADRRSGAPAVPAPALTAGGAAS